MIHSTTADRATHRSGMVVSTDHKVGYTVREIHAEKRIQEHSIPLTPGVSFYCLSGRGWASLAGGNIRYVIEPGVIFSAPRSEKELLMTADQDLTLLQIAYAGTDSPWAI